MAFEKTELATEHVVKNCMDRLYPLHSTDTPIIPLKDMAKLILIENVWHITIVSSEKTELAREHAKTIFTPFFWPLNLTDKWGRANSDKKQ